jgi:mono/diheme cytochrome c family protein
MHREPGRDRSRAARALVLAAPLAFAAAALLLPADGGAQTATPAVTPAAGPSLLTRLRAEFDSASLGRAGEIGAAAAAAGESTAPGEDWLETGFELTGEDLYRINCRSCHGVGGRGLGGDIPSILARLRQGAAEGGTTTELALRHRLLIGGQVMPAMAHLTPAEVEALLAHLEGTAGTAIATAPTRVRVPAMRVGEHVVKAVCQVCHDAVPGIPQATRQRIQPALSEIPDRYAVRALTRLVREAPATPGSVPAHRPRLGYLRSEELEAAYVYLLAYPPRTGE